MLSLAMVIGSADAPVLADHEQQHSQFSLWTPWDEAERLAILKRPGGMVLVPAGSFLMGSDPRKDRAAGPQELPQRQVFLDAFWIDRYEVSNIDYLLFVLATGASWPPYWRENPFPEKMALHPVIGVTWYEARDYCQWAQKRLLTEAEWEKAARGEQGAIFPWGDEPAGWLKSNIAHPGSKRGIRYPPLANVTRYEKGVSPYGAYQMAGNVSEWVADWFDPRYYQKSEVVNPKGPETGQLKVFRGGSWNEDPEVARSAGRNAASPDHRSYLIGFRCAGDAQAFPSIMQGSEGEQAEGK